MASFLKFISLEYYYWKIQLIAFLYDNFFTIMKVEFIVLAFGFGWVVYRAFKRMFIPGKKEANRGQIVP